MHSMACHSPVATRIHTVYYPNQIVYSATNNSTCYTIRLIMTAQKSYFYDATVCSSCTRLTLSCPVLAEEPTYQPGAQL